MLFPRGSHKPAARGKNPAEIAAATAVTPNMKAAPMIRRSDILEPRPHPQEGEWGYIGVTLSLLGRLNIRRLTEILAGNFASPRAGS